MCGVVGFSWQDRQLVERMLELLKYRGPDGMDWRCTTTMTLGQCRLAIVDASHTVGLIHNEADSVHVSYNGEIYNFFELQCILISKGHQFVTGNDGEVIVHGYEEWGEAIFERLDGMFAFALYDEKVDTLYLVRDQLGVKPLYYGLLGADIAFASEIKAILPVMGKVQVNEKALKDIMTYGYAPGPETPFCGVVAVRPGTFLRRRGSNLAEVRFSEFRRLAISHTTPNLSALLHSAVRKVAVAEVPIALALSGGLDSSLLAVIASKYNPNLKAFSIGFLSGDSEFEYSRMVAEHLGIAYEEVLVSLDEIHGDLPQILYHQEIPQDGGSVVPKWYLAKHISSQGYKVVIGGSGADEAFGGYTRCEFRYRQLTHNGEESTSARTYFDSNIMKRAGADWLYQQYLMDSPWFDVSSYFDVEHELPYYHNPRLDKTFMAHGIEYRVPYQDRSLVEYALNVPFLTRVAGGSRKQLLKDLAADLLPSSIVVRPKKPLQIPMARNGRDQWLDMLATVWRSVFQDWLLEGGQ